ncbi:MAG: polysialyltransferase family glycosyltransferase [Candidatus Woesearchaeota archaeon]|nr:polysialyltransferase family glycosyltransferase [Candidatus Woesearchaeota archaeon]
MSIADKKEGLYQCTEKLNDIDALTSITYDGVPLWWFYQIRFMRDALPEQFDNFEQIVKMQGKSALTRKLHHLRQTAGALMLARFLKINERMKQRMTKGQPTAPFTEQNTEQKNKKRALFLVHTIALDLAQKPFAIDRMQTVYEQLRKDRALATDILVVDPLSARFRPGLRRFPNLIYPWITKSMQAKTETAARQLHATWKKRKQDVLNATAHATDFEPALDFFFSKEMIYATILYYETFKRVLQETNTRALLIYSPAGVIDRCAIQAAHQCGIPTIRLTHGMGISTTLWTYPETFHVLANSDIEKERYIQLGAPPENVRVIGPVFLEGIQEYIARSKQQKYNKKKNKNKKPTILFCTAPIVQENIVKKERYFDVIRKMLDDLSSVNNNVCEVQVKLHPIEKYYDEYEKIIAEMPNKNITVIRGTLGKKQLYDLIERCDVFVSFFSTTLFEANLLNKPTILVELYDRNVVDNEGIFYGSSDAVLKIEPDYHNHELRTTLERVLTDTKLQKTLSYKRKEFIQKFFYKVDGKAPQRAAQEIRAIVQSYQKNKKHQKNIRSGREDVDGEVRS